MNSLSSVLRRRRRELGLTLAQIAEKMGVAEATVQRWESGSIRTLRQEKVSRLANILQVTPAALMGWEETLPSNVVHLHPMEKVPLIGQIACGTPILAEENITDYVDVPGHIHADYALTCRGDSMINAGIRDGDVVYIRQQEEVENGQIAAVLIDDEATLKRFYKRGDTLQLIPENPAFAPLVFVAEEMNMVRVLGLAVAYTHVI